jgi:hypothetical protein
MAQALTLCTLLTVSLTTNNPTVRASATSMAELLDGRLLAPMANASAFTGFMLAAATPWGFFRHYWVLTKFAITVIQLYIGIFILSGALHESASAAASGSSGPAYPLAIGSAFMASAIAFQAWLSVAKPWPVTPWTAKGGRRAPPMPTAPRWVFVATVCGGLADLVIAAVLGHPAPLLSLVVLITWLILRRRMGTTLSRPDPPGTPVTGTPLLQ